MGHLHVHAVVSLDCHVVSNLVNLARFPVSRWKMQSSCLVRNCREKCSKFFLENLYESHIAVCERYGLPTSFFNLSPRGRIAKSAVFDSVLACNIYPIVFNHYVDFFLF